MTMDRLKEENRRLRRRMRETKDALQDAEDTIEWIVKQFTGRRLSGARQEG
jgi:hypothetical protein